MFVKRILGFGLLIVAAAGSSLQAGQQAKFHLPFTATWANVQLPAGDYSLTLPEVGVMHKNFFVVGAGKHVLIPVLWTDMNVFSNSSDDRSYLTLRNIDGKYYIESYKSGFTGKEFEFHVPQHGVKIRFGKQEAVKLDMTGE
jgi:hypothetical protein